MKSIYYYPSPALQGYIEHYQFIEYAVKENGQLAVPDYPKTAMDMVFCFSGDFEIARFNQSNIKISKASFIAHFDLPYHILLKKDIALLHVRFKPNGIYPLTKIPLRGLLNNQTAIEDLLNKKVLEVLENMAEHASYKQRIQVLENYLKAIYQKSQLHHRLDFGLKIIQEKRGVLSVKELSDQLNSNYKSLDRWFQQNIGLSPKRFMKITRFKNILAELEQQEKTDWMDLVTKYGFHDQSHFIREFQEFAGTTPANFSFPALTNPA